MQTYSLKAFTPAHLPALVAFLNEVLVGRRHWVSINEADVAERVLVQPGFDARGLIMALAGETIAGAVHAVKPSIAMPVFHGGEPRHHITWLAVRPEHRGQGVAGRLLGAAENYLYYCPVHFAAQNAPFYGLQERLWVPWYGSTERLGVSAIHDKELIAWLSRRGYGTVNPGDVSMVASLHNRERPEDPGLAAHRLRLVQIDERMPWSGDEPFYQLRAWGHNGGRPYRGLVVADGDRAVGSVVWYPLPDPMTAALASIAIERPYRGLRYGSYLLDRGLADMAASGYTSVEVHVHSKENPEAFALFRRRGFEVIDYWVNLVKT